MGLILVVGVSGCSKKKDDPAPPIEQAQPVSGKMVGAWMLTNISSEDAALVKYTDAQGREQTAKLGILIAALVDKMLGNAKIYFTFKPDGSYFVSVGTSNYGAAQVVEGLQNLGYEALSGVIDGQLRQELYV